MSEPTSRATLQRRNDAGLIFAFLLLIVLPMADTFLHLDHATAPNENRTPAGFPAFQPSLRGARQYFAGLESYYGDNFGYRKQLVSWEQRLKWSLFRDSKPVSVLAGREGWLFYSAGQMIEETMGKRPFTEPELRDWLDFLNGRRDWLARRGIRYLLVIPPDKHTIYPEYLPHWLVAAAPSSRRLEQFVNYMSANSDLPILDLRAALLAEKKVVRVYLQTDSHWNEQGAFAASRRILERLSSPDAPLASLVLSDFRASMTDQPAGDLARMLGRERFLSEDAADVIDPRAHLSPMKMRIENIAGRTWVPGTEPVSSENPARTGRIVVFRDSFGTLLTKFLGHGFNRVIYLWRQNWDKELIEREMPDIVIDEMLERFVIARDPAELRREDELPKLQSFRDR